MSQLSKLEVISDSLPALLPLMFEHLPNEVIGCIFEAGLPPHVSPQLSPGHRGRSWPSIRGDCARALKRYQVLLGSISRLLREISHTTPSLWTTLVVCSPPAPDRVEFYDEMLEAVLKHSGGMKLDLMVFGGVDRGRFSPRSETLLAGVTDRAESLSSVQCSLFPTVSQPTQLTSLRIRRNAFWKTPEYPSNEGVSLFASSPRNLETLEYNDPYAPLELSTTPCDALRIFSYEARSLSGDAESFFKRCPNLNELHVNTYLNRSFHTFTSESLALLSIEGDGDFNSDSHLPFTGHLPKLSHLSMRLRTYSVGPNQADTSRNWPLLPSLRSLSLSSSPVWPTHIGAILRGPQVLLQWRYGTTRQFMYCNSYCRP